MQTVKMVSKILVILIVMILTLGVLKLLIPLNPTDRLHSIIQVVSYALVGGVVYVGLSFKFGVIDSLFGRNVFKKLLKVISFGRFGNKR